MAVAFESSSSGQDATGTSANVTALSVNGNVTNPLVLVFKSWRNSTGQTTTGCTHDGTGMVQVGSSLSEGGGAMAVYRLVGTSTTGSVIGSLNAAAPNLEIAALVFSGVDQTTPLGTPVVGQASGVDAAATTTGAATSAVGGMCADGLFIRGTPTSIAVLNAEQTEREAESVSGSMFLRCSTEDGAASVTMGWTWTNDMRWGHIVIPINAASGGGGEPSPVLGRRIYVMP